MTTGNMDATRILDIISTGETSTVQFKRELDSSDSLAAELIAMSNSKGGTIIIGVEDKTGSINGLSADQIHKYNEFIANIANEKVKPRVFITTEVVNIPNWKSLDKVIVIEVSEGTSKPYKDRNGTIWIKQGADKRRLTDNSETIRLFQQNGIVYLDEMIVPQTSMEDIDKEKVEQYMVAIHKRELDDVVEITETLLKNLNIIRDGRITLGGLLFFAKNPQKFRPQFCIKAVSYFGNSIGGVEYRSSKDIVGTIPEMFEQGMSFFTSNLHHIQAGQNFNSVGKLEISKVALEELLQNALIHRDYSKNASIKIMIFDNRIEILSPGALPNSLTVENIKVGNAVARNNLMLSYCSKLMIYRGFGSGIIRAIEHQPDIELFNDSEGDQFRITIPRPVIG